MRLGPSSIAILFGLLAPSGLSAQSAPWPTSEELHAVLDRPRLQSCDELTCYYRPSRNYDVRSIQCDTKASHTIVCTYERARFDPRTVRISRVGEPVPPDTRNWSAAETELMRLEHGWTIVRDSDD